MSVCCLLFFRVQRKVVSLCVYREGDWLRLQDVRERYDSINTLVMRYITTAAPISIGDHTVLAFFQYPVYSSSNDHVCIYVCIWLRVAFVRLNVPENTPIQSITRSARAH